MSSEFARNLLVAQRQRLTATIMQTLERGVYPRLSRQEQVLLRDKVIAAIGAYHDVVLDIVKSTVDDGVTNEAALEAIRALHADVKGLLAEARAEPVL